MFVKQSRKSIPHDGENDDKPAQYKHDTEPTPLLLIRSTLKHDSYQLTVGLLWHVDTDEQLKTSRLWILDWVCICRADVRMPSYDNPILQFISPPYQIPNKSLWWSDEWEALFLGSIIYVLYRVIIRSYHRSFRECFMQNNVQHSDPPSYQIPRHSLWWSDYVWI